MIPIIIMNHGLFGKELIATAEMVVGKLEEVQAVSLMPGMTLEDYLEQSEVAVNQAEIGRASCRERVFRAV